MLLENRVAIVTGAGQGIGFSIAEHLCKESAHVIIGELVEERGQAAAEKLKAKGYHTQAITLDVTKPEICKKLVNQVMKEQGRVDILVNNAGTYVHHKSEEMPESDWRFQIDVMLNGVFFMTQAVAQVMIPQKHGNIVNIASICGIGGWPSRSAYGAAKAGVICLTKILATEWAQYNIRVNSISPGVTKTEMVEKAIRDGAATFDKYDHRTPLGRVAEMDEIAKVALFLASDRASYITGENLRVDGGWSAWGNLNAVGFPEEDPNV